MAISRDVALAIFLVWIMVDNFVVFAYKTGAAENRDRFSLLAIVIVGPLAWAGSIGLAFGTMGAMNWLGLQVAGLALMAIGIAVRFTAIAQLGRFHTPNVAIRDDHRLIETGLYRLVRHPSYLGALIAFLGLGLALGNWLSLAVMMAITPCLYLYRMHEEEAALLTAFGEPYRAYCLRTKRLIPWLF